ncbi:MAG: hypothetical protein M3O36_02165, partial [Myxococcota bacterium]|nr:hypothetical protein [Myxococcota bacterium]
RAHRVRVIPAADEVLRGWKFVARRIGVEPVANVRAVEAALDHARALSTGHTDEAAALFYAFACRPRALVGGGRYVPILMVINEVRRAGLELQATRDDVEALRKTLLTADRPSFDEVRAWFAARLVHRT